MFQLRSSSSQQLQLPEGGTSGTSGSSSATSKPEATYYDDLYFDSDEDNVNDDDADDADAVDPKPSGSGSGKVPSGKSRREVKSNDDLMYDPDMDDEDQAWVDNIRQQYQSKFKQWVKYSHLFYVQLNLVLSGI